MTKNGRLIHEMVEKIVKNLDYDLWKDLYGGDMVGTTDELERIAAHFVAKMD